MTGLSFSRAPSEAHVNVLRGQERGTASAVNWMNLQSHPFAADLIKMKSVHVFRDMLRICRVSNEPGKNMFKP